MSGRVGLLDTFLSAINDSDPIDEKRDLVRLLERVRVDQMFCSPPGSLGGKGIVTVEDPASILRKRKLSPLEGSSVLFRMDLLRGRLSVEDQRVALYNEILALCEG